MKFAQMKIECPICQTKIKKVKHTEMGYWAECPNQCTRVRFLPDGKINSYIIKVHIDDKDYQFFSSRIRQDQMFGAYRIPGTNNMIETTTLAIHKRNAETDKWEFKDILVFNTYTDFEGVANDPWKYVQRLLNIKAFA